MIERLLLACCLALSAAGCGGKATDTHSLESKSAATRQLSFAADHSPSKQDSVPDDALVPLSELQPPVVRPQRRPVNMPVRDELRPAMEQADALYGKGSYSLAVAELERILTADADCIPARRLLALSYAGLGDMAKAIPNLNAVVEQAGDDAQVQWLLGRAAQTANRRLDAIVHYRTALICSDADPSSFVTGGTLLGLAEELHRAGYFQASLDAHLQLADHLDLYAENYYVSPLLRRHIQNPELLLASQGRILLALERYDQAVDVMTTAFRENKSQTEPVASLIEALVDAGRLDQAETLLLDLLDEPTIQEHSEKFVTSLYTPKQDAHGPRNLLKRYEASAGIADAKVILAIAGATYRLGDTTAAVEMLEAQVRIESDLSGVGARLAGWLIVDGNTNEAAEVLVKLLGQDETAVPMVRAVIVQNDAARFDDEFCRSFADAIAAAHQLHIRHLLLGIIHQARGRTALAREQMELAVQARPDFAAAYEELAVSYIRRADHQRLARLAETARLNLGDSYLTYYLTGAALLEQGNTDAAMFALHQALMRQETHAPSRVAVARALAEKKQFQEAEQQLKAAIQLGDEEFAYELLVQILLQQNKPRNALAVVEEMLRRNGENVPALRMMAQLQMLMRQPTEAGQTLDRLLAVAPHDRDGLLLRARLAARGIQRGWLSKARFDRSIRYVQTVTQADPQDIEALRLEGQLFASRKLHDQAAETLAKVHQLSQDVADLLPYLMLLEEADRRDEAAELLRHAHESQPDNLTLMLTYVNMLSRNDRYDEAIELLEAKIDDAGPHQLQMKMMLADIRGRAGQTDEALAMLDSIAEKADSPEQRGNILGVRYHVYAQSGRHDLLNEPLEQRITEDLQPTMTVLALPMLVLIEAGQVERAEAFAADQIKRLIDSENPAARDLGQDAQTAVVALLAQRGHKEAMQRLYESFLAVSPRNVELLAIVQLIYDDQPHRVEESLKLALEIEPDNPDICNNLGYHWADRGVNLIEAETLLRWSDSKKPSPHVKDSLGWLKYKQGDFAAALNFLTLALSDEEGDSSVVYDHAGDILWRLGNKDRAVSMWIEAADLAEAELEFRVGSLDREIEQVLESAVQKVDAVREGREPKVAPLGDGVIVH